MAALRCDGAGRRDPLHPVAARRLPQLVPAGARGRQVRRAPGARGVRRLHLRLYEAFFTHSVNIAQPRLVAVIRVEACRASRRPRERLGTQACSRTTRGAHRDRAPSRSSSRADSGSRGSGPADRKASSLPSRDATSGYRAQTRDGSTTPSSTTGVHRNLPDRRSAPSWAGRTATRAGTRTPSPSARSRSVDALRQPVQRHRGLSRRAGRLDGTSVARAGQGGTRYEPRHFPHFNLAACTSSRARSGSHPAGGGRIEPGYTHARRECRLLGMLNCPSPASSSTTPALRPRRDRGLVAFERGTGQCAWAAGRPRGRDRPALPAVLLLTDAALLGGFTGDTEISLPDGEEGNSWLGTSPISPLVLKARDQSRRVWV